MTRRFGLALILAVGAGGAAWGQEAKGPAAPLLSPSAALVEAVHPVEVTRRSVSNWSETEQAALGVAMKQAAAACAARKVEDYDGDPLVDLARLCALGQGWQPVIAAVDRYLAGKPAASLRMGLAYAAKVDAELHLKDEGGAKKTVEEMLGAAPYTADVADAVNQTLDYMQLLYTGDAVEVAERRQVVVLGLLKPAVAAEAPEAKEMPVVAVPVVGVSRVDLFSQALRLAALEQLAVKPDVAAAVVVALEAAVPADLTGDEKLQMDAARKRYAQLGQPLGEVGAIASLDVTGQVPDIPARRAITALLLFPDWCAQCVRLARQIPVSVFTVQGHEAYMYGLLVETTKPAKGSDAELKDANRFNPAYAEQYLRGTPTVTAGAGLLDSFSGVDVPLLVVADSAGVVRFFTTVDDDAFQPGMTLDSAVGLVGRQWPGAERRAGPVADVAE